MFPRLNNCQSNVVMKKAAVIKGIYRYSLTREWDIEKPSVLFIMLNPSTADAFDDDNTIRRCIGFAKRWGCGSIEVVNVFALRSRDPLALRKAYEPIGSENAQYILEAVRRASKIILAWGNHVLHVSQASSIMNVITSLSDSETDFYCLGLTKEHQPKHPLMLSYGLLPQKCMVHKGERGYFVDII